MSVVTTTILSEGKTMPATYELMSVDISKEVNRIARAQLTLIDGDAASGEFLISDTAFFEPGKSIEIKLRYEGKTKDLTVFKGIVVRHSIAGSTDGSQLIVELKDPAVMLTQVRKTRIFAENETDSKIISDILKLTPIDVGQIADTLPKHEEIVQYNATDWDFIVSRADINGCLVAVDDGKISMVKMGASGGVLHKFDFGLSSIFDFEIELNAESQFSDVKAFAWDTKTQKRTAPIAGEDVDPMLGDLKGKALSKKLGFGDYILSHPVPLVTEEQSAWANARMARNRLSMVRGRISVPGDGELRLMDRVEVSKFGNRFTGKSTITGLSHRVTTQGWQTDLQYGLSPDWFCNENEISAAPSAGLLPPVNGLQIGVVSAFKKDETGEFRVRVSLPAISTDDPDGGQVWARLATPDGGKGRGYLFRPEPGDEVIVGFFNDDPRQPVILGAMFGSVNTLPTGVSEPDEKNDKKAIVTRSGLSITFMDREKPSMAIATPNGNKIVFSDDEETTEISDQHGNTIVMNKDGIELKSSKDFKITASGNVEIAGAKVDIK
jgi:uncharacterized protein involved in type VI secretion and phage assembly